MANKALSKRQKLTFRSEPAQRALKPRNPLVVPARLRVAGPHKKTTSAKRQQERLALLNTLFKRPDDE